MKEIKSDFFQHLSLNIDKYDCIVCTTNKQLNKNNELVMGAGIAKAFKDKFPFLPKVFGNQIIERKDGIVSYYHEGRYKGWIIGLPTKDDWKNNSNRSLVDQSIYELYWFHKIHRIKSILMTKPGCGLGGLNWQSVKKIFDSYVYGKDNFLDKITIIGS